MPVSVKEDPANHFHIAVDGGFTRNTYPCFIDAVNWVLRSSKSVTFDFQKAEYIEASALGLLLLARGELPHKNAILKVNEGSDFEKLLETSRFGELFTVQAI